MLRTEQSTVGPRTAWGFRVLIFHAVDSLSMAPSDREAQPQTAQSLLSGLEGGLCRAVPSRGGGRQPQTALPRVLAASWTPPQAPGKTGGCGGWWHSGQLALGCTWCPGHLRMPRLTCGSQDFRRQCSTIFFSFLSFQLQLTFCMNSHQFLVCGTVVRHLYTLRSDPPPRLLCSTPGATRGGSGTDCVPVLRFPSRGRCVRHR